jgi:hypothetical protein
MIFDYERVKRLAQQPDLEQALYNQDLLDAFTAGIEMGYAQGIKAMEDRMAQVQLLLLRTGGSA